MVKLSDLSLLDTGKAATLTDNESESRIEGHIIADPLWKGKIAFLPLDGEVISIFDTDEIELLQ
jgi:hypothetical protein